MTDYRDRVGKNSGSNQTGSSGGDSSSQTLNGSQLMTKMRNDPGLSGDKFQQKKPDSWSQGHEYTLSGTKVSRNGTTIDIGKDGTASSTSGGGGGGLYVEFHESVPQGLRDFFNRYKSYYKQSLDYKEGGRSLIEYVNDMIGAGSGFKFKERNGKIAAWDTINDEWQEEDSGGSSSDSTGSQEEDGSGNEDGGGSSSGSDVTEVDDFLPERDSEDLVVDTTVVGEDSTDFGDVSITSDDGGDSTRSDSGDTGYETTQHQPTAMGSGVQIGAKEIAIGAVGLGGTLLLLKKLSK